MNTFCRNRKVSGSRSKISFELSGEYSRQTPTCNDTRYSDDPALLQELLLAQRANDVEGFKGWMALGLDELGRQVVIELMQGWMSPLLTEGEQDRLVGWHLGVSL